MSGRDRLTGALRRALAVCGSLALLVGLPADEVASQPAPTRVLLLYAHPPEADVVSDFARALRATIRSGTPAHVEFYEEYLDLDRFTERAWQPELGRHIAVKYRRHRLDVIVVEGALALDFLSTHLAPRMPDVPVVYALVAERDPYAPLPRHVTGRTVPLPFRETFELARRLQPNALQIVIVGGDAPRDSVAVAAALRDIEPVRGALPVVLLRGLDFEQQLDQLSRLHARSIVMMALIRRDRRGQLFVPGEDIERIAQVASAPVYGVFANSLGQGVVGGAMIRFDEEGRRTGRLVLGVLRRRPDDPMHPGERASATVMVDARAMRRWRLNRDRLPPTAAVYFATPSRWSTHRLEILIGGAVLVVQALLIAGLLVERARRMRAQRDLVAQSAYERTIADLTTEAVRHAPDDTPHGLEVALERIARFAGATSAELLRHREADGEPPEHWSWRDPHPHGESVRETTADASSRLEIELEADGAAIGVLTLRRPARPRSWPPRLRQQLEAAAEIIASAMARARAVKAARRGEELNRAVLASLPTQIAILDARGTIVRVNEAWRERARQGDALGTTCVGQSYLAECERAESRGCLEARDARIGIARVLARELPAFRMEYFCASPDRRWYELYVDYLAHEDGGAIVSHLDVTERRQSELNLEESKRRLAHVGRITLVGEMTAMIAHEIRQPLAAIRANAEAGIHLLAAGAVDIKETRSILRDIVADDVRANDVIEHIRSLLRDEAPEAVAVDVNEVCRQAMRLLEREAVQRRARLVPDLTPGLPTVLADAVQLQQVVLNLGLNALEAVAMVGAEAQSVVRVCTRRHEELVEIAVRDSGAGIPPDVERQLFSSYITTKASGLGLGLVIVRSIVERHGGRVHAENDVAGGAVFRVRLPIAGATGQGGALPSPLHADRALSRPGSPSGH